MRLLSATARGVDMTTQLVFLFGAIGALAPEVIRLYNLRQGGAGSFSIFYVAVSVAFACLGGFVAAILPATTALAAFYAGISTPMVVNTALRQSTLRAKGQLKGPLAESAQRPANFQRFVNAL